MLRVDKSFKKIEMKGSQSKILAEFKKIQCSLVGTVSKCETNIYLRVMLEVCTYIVKNGK